MNRRQKILNSIAAIAIVVALTLGGYYIADSVTGKNTTLADNLRALGFDLPRAKVSVPTNQTTEVLVSESGAAGAAGVVGADGEAGATGRAGATGTSGKPGTAGTSGTSGTSGTAGSNGADGLSGVAGESGATGSTGSTGATGSMGSPGADGAAGSNGAAGVDGATGGIGADGVPGSIGATGTPGGTGAPGPAGPQGPAGSGGGSLTTSIPKDLELNLENQVFGLTSGIYALADGFDGQQVFFFAADGAELNNITILVRNLRVAADKGSVTIRSDVTWVPFNAELASINVVSAIFAQGAWTITGGYVL